MAGVRVNVVTGQTCGHLDAGENNVADVSQDVAVAGIERRILGAGEIHGEILKQIVAGNERVGIGEPGRT